MLIRAILITTFAFMATSAGIQNAIAQDATVKSLEKTKPAPRPKSMDAIKEAVKDLTDEQKEKLEALRKKAVAQQTALRKSASISWRLSEQRREAYEKLKAKGLKGKKLSAQANKEVGYTKEQTVAQTKVGKVWNDYRYAIVNVLSAEQKRQLPTWLTDGHAARAKAEKVKAAAKKKS
ncbi:hypothetical protein [Planctomycetes bacterium K23_9]|uniref:LTXXQ motif protein n=1 Tax=Stieleria marina TaxID=1930275 RepID=A0A517NWQ3_9BACT|nr:hypothetical protein K239x_35590 [Planctomycetes bacterium K23_9]